MQYNRLRDRLRSCCLHTSLLNSFANGLNLFALSSHFKTPLILIAHKKIILQFMYCPGHFKIKDHPSIFLEPTTAERNAKIPPSLPPVSAAAAAITKSKESATPTAISTSAVAAIPGASTTAIAATPLLVPLISATATAAATTTTTARSIAAPSPEKLAGEGNVVTSLVVATAMTMAAVAMEKAQKSPTAAPSSTVTIGGAIHHDAPSFGIVNGSLNDPLLVLPSEQHSNNHQQQRQRPNDDAEAVEAVATAAAAVVDAAVID